MLQPMIVTIGANKANAILEPVNDFSNRTMIILIQSCSNCSKEALIFWPPNGCQSFQFWTSSVEFDRNFALLIGFALVNLFFPPPIGFKQPFLYDLFVI